MGVDIHVEKKESYQLIIWGIGRLSAEIERNGLNGVIIGYVETHKSRECYRGRTVYEIDSLPERYDYIIVANTCSDEIYGTCVNYGIDINKCIFFQTIKQQVGFRQEDIVYDILGEKNFTNYCAGCGIRKNTFFENDMKRYNELNTRENFQLQEDFLYPIIADRYAEAGSMGSYFWQDLWAAKLIHQSGIKSHFDIGSRIDGFIAHLLAMDISVTLIDVREFPGEVENLHTIVSDATNLSQVEDESIDSLSALCSLEHFGLGRYGDPINPEACFLCFEAIQKKLKKGGHLYISVPIGKERVEFNAHRVFFAKTIVECFNQMNLIELSYTVRDKIEYHIELSKYDDNLCKGDFGFGLFHFVKR